MSLPLARRSLSLHTSLQKMLSLSCHSVQNAQRRRSTPSSTLAELAIDHKINVTDVGKGGLTTSVIGISLSIPRFGKSTCIFVAFDLLYLNGKDMRTQPLIERK
jgi:hypothetical protein